jgi:hypothetical protein
MCSLAPILPGMAATRSPVGYVEYLRSCQAKLSAGLLATPLTHAWTPIYLHRMRDRWGLRFNRKLCALRRSNSSILEARVVLPFRTKGLVGPAAKLLLAA